MPTFTNDALAHLVAETATLHERISGTIPVTPLAQPDSGNDILIQSRLEQWKKSVAKGDGRTFRTRLEWDHINLEETLPLLGAVRLVHPEDLPAWALLLRDMVEALTPESASASYHFLNSNEEDPFEDLLAPMVALASERVRAKVGDVGNLLPEAAWISMERSLLVSFIRLTSRPLYIAFSVQRQEQPLSFQESSEDPTHLYKRFVNAQADGTFLDLIHQYPMLGRLMGTVALFWIETQIEFITRLAADYDIIGRTFEHPLGAVKRLDARLSDPHQGRRSVYGLTFESGQRLIYKPRDLSFEMSYFAVLEWINQHGIDMPFKVFRVINRENYGWVEFIDHLPVTEEAGFSRYYYRAGMLLALLHTLNCTDVHNENIIAHGEHPTLIDMETLLFPEIRSAEEILDQGPPMLAQREFSQSVINVGMLPQWEPGNDGRAIDISGLGRSEPIQYTMSVWKFTNTDAMGLFDESVTAPEANNIPFIMHDGEQRFEPVDSHYDELIEGFKTLYRFLLEHRDALLAEDSPIHGFNHKLVRFIFRATRIYGGLMERLMMPEAMGSGIAFSQILEMLTRAFLLFPSQPPTWHVMHAEVRALTQLDIPYFEVDTAHDALGLPTHKSIDHIFLMPSFESCLAHIKALSPADMNRQVAFIQGVLFSRTARDAGSVSQVYGALIAPSSVEPVDSEALIAEARNIGELIRANAVRDAKGASWMSYDIMNGKHYSFKPMGQSLYEGISGIVLFLTALQRVTGADYQDLITDALRPGKKELEDPGALYRMVRDTGIGGGTGISSTIYALSVCASVSGDSSFLDLAQQLTRGIQREHIEQDTAFDVIVGSAGAILSLLSYHKLSNDPAALERAIWCGNHLLDTRIPSAYGPRAWATVANRILTGFSHGTAGIAYALLRLYEATGDSRYRDAAEEAIAYETAVYTPDKFNWPDFRNTEESTEFRLSWCHGAPGIGLARLGGLAMLDTPQVRQDIENALQSTKTIFSADLDHLCCGVMGRVEMLLTAGNALKRPDLNDFARRDAAWLMLEAQRKHGYTLFPNLPESVNHFGLFQGITGIGYEMLRLAHPDQLPSVLLWNI